jgi:hypothetical protein
MKAVQSSEATWRNKPKDIDPAFTDLWWVQVACRGDQASLLSVSWFASYRGACGQAQGRENTPSCLSQGKCTKIVHQLVVRISYIQVSDGKFKGSIVGRVAQSV